MKVCILTSVHPPFDNRIFHKQAKSLVKAGYDVTLVAQHDKNENVDGVRIVALPKFKNRFYRMLSSLRLLRLALNQHAEVYHFHDPEIIPAAVLLKIMTQAKIIYDVHEDVPKQILTKEWMPSYSRGFVSRLFTLIERVSLPFFDAVVTAGEDIAGHFPRSTKVVSIRNFASLDMTRETKEKPERRAEQELATLIYVGRLSVHRGIREMVESVRCLKGKARLVLAGTFSESQLEYELRREAGKEVQLIGQVPYEEVFSLLGKADVGLICLQPTPNNMAIAWRNNKLFEYMATGLPVIASNFPAFKDVVEGDNCGLTVNPLNPREIAKAAEYLIEHPDEARKMGENGRKAVVKKYNWETESRKLIAVYEGLLAGRRKRL